MADLFDWSTTAGSNTTVDGTNIAEGCAAGNLNNGIRSVMALVRNSFATALKTFLNGTAPLPVANGGTASTTAADARTALSAAKSGANSDITSLTGLTTPLSVAQGGTGAATAGAALASLGAAASNAAFGVGQTYSNPARSFGATYTNSTNRPIFVFVVVNNTTLGGAKLNATVGGVSFGSFREANGATQISFIVPPGLTYSVAPNIGTGTLVTWAELS